MRKLDISLKADHFNLIWVSLHAREQQLLKVVEDFGEDSDQGADALNDIVYLRLYRNSLREKAEPIFNKSVFIVGDEPYDI